MLELIDKGGFMMYPIIISSILAFAVILDRLYFFRIEYPPPGKEVTRRLFELIKTGETAGADAFVSGLKTRFREYYLAILHEHDPEEREHAAEVAGDEVLYHLNRRLNLLNLIGAITPLMGLLGTVLGMIRVFSRVARVGSVTDIAVLAGGIWEALITTAAGMMVAIPVMIVCHYFQRCLSDTAHQMQQGGERLIKLLAGQGADS